MSILTQLLEASSSGQQHIHVVQGLLQQLVDSVSAIQQQKHPAGANTTADIEEHNPVTAVQVRLRACDTQLLHLLLQHGRTSDAAATAAAATANQHKQQLLPDQPQCQALPLLQPAGPQPSIAVLQKLLQLAVDSPAGQTATDGPTGQQVSTAAPAEVLPANNFLLAAGSRRCARQQQEWTTAAGQALELFSVCELEQLPPHSLQQALLLRPQLLVPLLESASAAVLQPVLAAADLTAPAARTGADTTDAASSSSSSSCPDGSGAASLHSIQSLLAASCPWVAHLPQVLAGSPLLLLQASCTLLSWLEASGHTRLWQLLSIICRPAWQHLTAAAAAAAATHVPAGPISSGPSRPALAGAGMGLQGTSAAPGTAVCINAGAGNSSCISAGAGNSSSTSTSSRCTLCGLTEVPRQQLLCSGALQLLCPQPWQQCLVRVLVQEPSVVGLLQLLQLLQLLPGVAWMQLGQQHTHKQKQAAAVPADSGLGPYKSRGAAGDADAASPGSIAELAWPRLDEWSSRMTAAAAGGGAERGGGAGAEDGTSGKQHQQDEQEVMCAWGLLMQHHCWYQFACWLLVHSSLCQLQERHAHQHQGPLPPPTALAQEAWELLQRPAADLQQCAGALSWPLLAAAAAGLIAWVQEPAAGSRQSYLWRQLLRPVHDLSYSSDRPLAAGQAPVPSLADLAAMLQQSWAAGKCQPRATQPLPQQGSSGVKSTQDAVRRTPAVGPALCSTAAMLADLSCAVLQQRQLLLYCSAQQLLNICLRGSALAGHSPRDSSAVQQQQEAAPSIGVVHVRTKDAAATSKDAAANSQGSKKESPRLPAAAICQLLDSSNGVCAAALEVFNAAVQQAQAPLQQQQQQPPLRGCRLGSEHLGPHTALSWLAQAWLQPGGVSSGPGAAVVMRELSLATQLLAAATGMDQHLKLYGQGLH